MRLISFSLSEPLASSLCSRVNDTNSTTNITLEDWKKMSLQDSTSPCNSRLQLTAWTARVKTAVLNKISSSVLGAYDKLLNFQLLNLILVAGTHFQNVIINDILCATLVLTVWVALVTVTQWEVAQRCCHRERWRGRAVLDQPPVHSSQAKRETPPCASGHEWRGSGQPCDYELHSQHWKYN